MRSGTTVSCRSRSAASAAGYQGDNIALTSTGDTLRPVWTDNSSGIYQLWTCAVALPFHPNPVDEPATLPDGYALEQNYPNPFNPSTVIRFTLPRAEEVTISVYDLAGRMVTTLVSGRLPAGAHTTVFSGGGGTDRQRNLPLRAGNPVGAAEQEDAVRQIIDRFR